MRNALAFLVTPILLALAGCRGADPTPDEGASASAVQASVNQANALQEQAENRAEDLEAAEADNASTPRD